MVPSVLASSNSGPGGGGGDNDDRDDRDDRTGGQITMQDPSTITTSITIPVDAESYSAANPYSPNPATVSSGSTVIWSNVDDDPHSATADDGSFSTGILEPGESGQAVINAEPGAAISYHCDVHPEMRGILQVSDAAGNNVLPGNVAMPSQSIGLTSSLLQISDQPLAVGHYTTVSENAGNNMIQLSIAGNTTITLPNSTETTVTNDTGNVTITFTESGMGILDAQIYMTTGDGSENATIIVAEFFSGKNAPGRGLASFSTASTGRLAPLDSIVAIVLDEDQPDGSSRVSFFEWNAGPVIDNSELETPVNSSENGTSDNQTTTTPIPSMGADEGGGGSNTIEVSITSGSSSKTDNAFDPNPVQASVGDTVVWTNDDTTPHTVTSGSNAQSDGKFDSSPNLNPLLAPGETFEHTFEEEGEYPYYCQLHPNMVGTVSVS
jgi:plastocyanin